MADISKIKLEKYNNRKNSLSLIAKDNPKDKIDVEIGDSKDLTKFQPQVKIMRWDNEVNFSVRLKDDRVRLLRNRSL